MRPIEIAGVGLTSVGEHWEASLSELAFEAGRAALSDAAGERPGALFVGSALGAIASGQANLGTAVAEALGLPGVEAHAVEADGASGAAALRLAELAVMAGVVECALVVAVEKTSDLLRADAEAARAASLDAERDGAMGVGPAAAAALLHARYLHEHRLEPQRMGVFPRLAHDHARTAAHAFLRKGLSAEGYAGAAPVAPPVSVMDCAPELDGAAAVVLRPARAGRTAIRITGSAVVTGPVGLAARAEPLVLGPAAASVRAALAGAGRSLREVSLAEPDDAYSILAALSVEAIGLADRGQAVVAAEAGRFALGGATPICTFGGSKARGNPVGAAGLYRVVEAVWQLRGTAADNQVRGARVALTQSLGSLGATAITHVLE